MRFCALFALLLLTVNASDQQPPIEPEQKQPSPTQASQMKMPPDTPQPPNAMTWIVTPDATWTGAYSSPCGLWSSPPIYGEFNTYPGSSQYGYTLVSGKTVTIGPSVRIATIGETANGLGFTSGTYSTSNISLLVAAANLRDVLYSSSRFSQFERALLEAHEKGEPATTIYTLRLNALRRLVEVQ